MTQEERALRGIVFSPGDRKLSAMKRRTHDLNMEYNATSEGETERRERILTDILGEKGENCRIQGPVFFHYGRHTRIGKNFFANFNLTIQDDGPVTIGDDNNFGPGVTIVTPVHPMPADERRFIKDAQGNPVRVCYARPVTVGNDCWLGANVVLCPGVTVGDRCVIGAGSVVTRDIPPDSFAAGNPCRVIRTITDADSLRHLPDVLADYTVD